MTVGMLGDVPYLFIELAVKQTGTFDPKQIMPIISENLTPEQCAEIEPFLSWLHTNGRTIGHSNYDEVYAEYLTQPLDFVDALQQAQKEPKNCIGIFPDENCPNNAKAEANSYYCADCYNVGADLAKESEVEERVLEMQAYEDDPDYLDDHWKAYQDDRDSDEPKDEPDANKDFHESIWHDGF